MDKGKQMAKLTKAQRIALGHIRYDLARGAEYLREQSTFIGRKKSAATTTIDFSRPSDGVAVCEIEKEYGSNLCGVFSALESLDRLLSDK
jgi:hypothetical protein